MSFTLIFELYLFSLPCSFFLIITDFSEGAFLFKIDFTESYARKVAMLERVSNKQVVPQVAFSSSDTNITPFAPWVYLLFYDLSLKKQIINIITIKLLISYGLCFSITEVTVSFLPMH